MRRFLVTVLLILLVAPIFAMDSQIGASIAPEWFFVSKMEDMELSETGMTRFYLTIDGANYFGQNGGFGIEYGLGVIFPVNTWSGNVTIDAEGGSGFAFRAGVGYRHEFNSLIGIAAGLGVNGTYDSETRSSSGSTATVSELDLGIYGRVSVDFTFIDCVRINAGIAMGGPVYSNMKMSLDGQSQSADLGISGFYISPFVGIAYAY